MPEQIACAVAVALAGLSPQHPSRASAEEPSKAELDAVREALAKYKDPMSPCATSISRRSDASTTTA